MIAYLLIFRDDEANMLAARGILNASARVCNEVAIRDTSTLLAIR